MNIDDTILETIDYATRFMGCHWRLWHIHREGALLIMSFELIPENRPRPEGGYVVNLAFAIAEIHATRTLPEMIQCYCQSLKHQAAEDLASNTTVPHLAGNPV